MSRETLLEGVTIDLCPEHGVWLDIGELELIRAMATTSGAPNESSGVRRVAETAGRRFVDSAVFGAGATVGNRIVDGILSAVLLRK
jgi:hypothetical protein